MDKQTFFEATKPKSALVEVNGVTVRVRELSARALQDLLEIKDRGEFLVRLVLSTVVDEQGSPLFTEDDVGRLHDTSPHALKVLADKAIELSGFAEKN
jgi:hypothetical protein